MLASLLPIAALLSLTAQAAEPPKDPLLEQRRSNLPKTLPWPTSFFQPQIAVPGAPRSTFRLAAPGKRTLSAATLAEAEAYAAEQKSTALLIYQGGELQHMWFAPGTNADTISHTYNMQYTPLVLLVGIAMAEGKIKSLDEPASRYLPEWRNDSRSKITIRNLLQQNAGLELRRDAHYSEGLYSRDARAYWGSRTKEVLVREYPVLHAPGTVFDYNYIVPELLSIILERATGQPYQQYLSRKLWQPLGNKTAYLWLNRPGGEAHVDAGLFSAPTDWINVGVLLLQEGKWKGRQLVPRSYVREMMKPSATNPNFGFMYLGSPFAPVRRMSADPRVTYVVKSAEPFAADDVAYIDGYGGQRSYVIPSRQMVVVRIGDVAREWDNSRLVNILLREPAKRAGGARPEGRKEKKS
jgi:CubicO group peptidase (beta-lactamase class C family)